MKPLTDPSNIGKVLAENLNSIGVSSYEDLKAMGSEDAIMKIATIKDSGACINMLYALEGAIQGIRWHGLSSSKKEELKAFYQMVNKSIK